MASAVAVKLLMGTAAQESQLGRYLHQMGKGPAVGAFQMEPLTFKDLQDRFGKKFPMIVMRKAEEMEWDLRLAIVMARIKYYSIPHALPADTLTEVAAYWKRWYNTPKGKGTEQEFVDNYIRYVGSPDAPQSTISSPNGF